ncbi:MAG: hypothetical protein FWG85_03240 [Bacteroidetes bacterium]|nr:hypothetical protein [Bacteroidota bacterium]
MLSEENKTITYTPEIIWQMFAETDKKIKEVSEQIKKNSDAADRRSAETDKQIKKNSDAADRRSAETDRFLSEKFAETDKKIKELTRNIGGIAESNGKMAEQMIYNSLEREMKFAGIEFYYIERNKKRKIKILNLEGEYDIVLTNGDTIGIIETKYQVRKKDILKLITTQLENFRKLFKEYENYKIILGVGGIFFDAEAEKEAKEKGIAVIKVTTENVEYFTEGIRIY